MIPKSVTKNCGTLNSIASGLAVGVSFLCFTYSMTSQASACTIDDSVIASGQTTICSGSYTEETYSVPGVTNVTVINNGNWTETGNLQSSSSASVLGPRNTNINYTGLSITNNGSLSWTNASATNIGSAGNRTMSVLGTYFQNISSGSTYINNGSIVGIAGATNIYSFTGIGNVGRSGSLYSENAGSIYIDVSSLLIFTQK